MDVKRFCSVGSSARGRVCETKLPFDTSHTYLVYITIIIFWNNIEHLCLAHLKVLLWSFLTYHILCYNSSNNARKIECRAPMHPSKEVRTRAAARSTDSVKESRHEGKWSTPDNMPNKIPQIKVQKSKHWMRFKPLLQRWWQASKADINPYIMTMHHVSTSNGHTILRWLQNDKSIEQACISAKHGSQLHGTQESRYCSQFNQTVGLEWKQCHDFVNYMILCEFCYVSMHMSTTVALNSVCLTVTPIQAKCKWYLRVRSTETIWQATTVR